jgi:hypothetical protein
MSGEKNSEAVINRLKTRFRIESDAELAERLRLSRSAVANWRNRGEVPKRYVDIADGAPNQPVWSNPSLKGYATDIETAAELLAAMRLVRDFGDIAKDYNAFLARAKEAALSVTSYRVQACTDIAAGVDNRDGQMDAYTVALLIAHSEISAA